MTTGARTLVRFGTKSTSTPAPLAALGMLALAPREPALAAALVFVFLVFFPRFGSYSHRAKVAVSRIAILTIGLALAWPPLSDWVRASVVATALGLGWVAVAEAFRSRRFQQATRAGEPTLLVGEPEAVRDAAALFSAYDTYNVWPVATATPDGLTPTVLPGGTIRDVPSLISDYNVEHVICVSASVAEKLEFVIGRERPMGVRLSAVHPLGEILTGKVDVVSVRGLPFVTLAPRRPPAGPSWALKRTLDYVAGGIGLVAISPVLLVAAIAVKLDSRGPVFFRQERIGRNGRPFRVWKFRSMCEDAEDQLDALRHRNEASGAYFKIEHDPRVTRVGKWLRRLSIDELPQLFNVMRGEMSLVGPRPFLASELAADPEAFEWRLPFLPGITGLWQIAGRSWLPRLEGLRMDLSYIEHWSPALDLRILFRTAVVAFKNDRRPPVNENPLQKGLNRDKYLGLVNHDDLVPATGEVDVSIVIVTHESEQHIAACLDALDAMTDTATREIIVVDNVSTDKTVELVRARNNDEIRLIRKRQRGGFSANSNIGAAAASGRHVLFLNPDTRVTDGVLDTMVRYLDDNVGVGAVGPRLLYPDGSLQWSARRFPRVFATLIRRTPLRFFMRNSLAIRDHLMADMSLTSVTDVDWLLGAALAVRRTSFDAIGGFDDGFRLYCEDIDICWRLQNVGWKVRYLPQATVEHDLGELTSKTFFTVRQVWHFRSMARFIRLHGFRRPSADGTNRRMMSEATTARARVLGQTVKP